MRKYIILLVLVLFNSCIKKTKTRNFEDLGSTWRTFSSSGRFVEFYLDTSNFFLFEEGYAVIDIHISNKDVFYSLLKNLHSNKTIQNKQKVLQEYLVSEASFPIDIDSMWLFSSGSLESNNKYLTYSDSVEKRYAKYISKKIRNGNIE